MAATISKNRLFLQLAIVAVTVSLSFISASGAATAKSFKDRRPTLVKSLFPKMEVTLTNNGDNDLYYMCNIDKSPNSTLERLKKGEYTRFQFIQYAYPMRWCFAYIDKDVHGFLWAFSVRLRCTKCFWRFENVGPTFYKADRTRWEQQRLFMPMGYKLNITQFLRNPKPATPGPN